MELTAPIYQECLTPLTCGNKIGARCEGFGESCAQSDPEANPCDFHCVSECPVGQVSRIIEYEDRGSFRKCIPESELDDENMLICSSPEDGPAQFEIQVPRIKRHKYLKDERQYSLISDFDSTNPGIFGESRLAYYFLFHPVTVIV